MGLSPAMSFEMNVFGKVFDFLGLPPHKIRKKGHRSKTKYEPMSEAAVETLQSFFRPLNKRLAHILGGNMTLPESWQV